MRDRENDGKLESRIFVGGLSSDVTEKQLETSFDRFGKIIECQIMMERDTGRPRGFGFITFTDRREADDAIKNMHGRVLGDKVISVNKADPKAGGEDADHFHKGGGGYSSSRGKGGDRGGEDDKCFKCGRLGHWARDCPSTGGDRGRFRDSIFSRLGDRSGDRERERDRYMDGRRDHDGGRYGYRDRYEGGDKYDHYPMERYPPPGEERLVSDRYGGMPELHHHHHHHPENEYRGRERSYERDRYARDARDASDRYGPLRDEGRGYRSRPGPYDRPSRAGGRPSSYEQKNTMMKKLEF